MPSPVPAAVAAPRVGPRIVAYLLDMGLATMLAVAAVGLLDPAPGRSTTVAELGFGVVMWALVRVVAPGVTGESPGKRMLGLGTVDAAGAPIGTRTRAFRELVVWLLYWIPLFAPIDAVVAERRAGRSTRDQLAKTTVTGTRDASGTKISGVAVLAALALAAGWFTLGAWDSRPDRVERAIIAECGAQGGSIAQCHCVFQQLNADLDASQLSEARGVLAGERFLLGSESGEVVQNTRAAWSSCVTRAPASMDSAQHRAERWRKARATAIDVCSRTASTAVCTCIIDRAAADIGTAAMLDADRTIVEQRVMPPELQAAFDRALRVCADAGRTSNGRV